MKKKRKRKIDTRKNFDIKKIEYSKILATASLLLFICTLFYGYAIMTYLVVSNTTSLFDIAFFGTAITITGGVFMTTAKHYYSKSGLQNTCHIRNGVYDQIMKVRLRYIEEVLKLKVKYGVTDIDINTIEIDSPFVEISNSFLNNTSIKLDEVQTINESEPEGEIN